MKRSHLLTPARELLTRSQSTGGCYHLKSAEDLIAYHRKLKNRTLTDWPGRIHRILSVSLFFAFLGVLSGVWSSVLCCTGSDLKTSQGCFTAAIWASGVMTVLILAKCWANSKFPQS
jgi:hypothetical protein